ncbi:MAG TPA: hypothetical protein VMU52_06135 [Steroidobacteraceae bacterium]|nr:hypothetical protein [Steroidobacteraceae bacterium]
MTIDNTARFERLLAALEHELTGATDEEILEAAGDLGMNPAMKGSAAFFGVTVDLRAKWGSYPGQPPDAPGGSARRGPKDDPSS